MHMIILVIHTQIYSDLATQQLKLNKQQSSDQVKCGSWDPKFLEKKNINKYHHNNGQGYQDGQISNWSTIMKSSGYNKVKGKSKIKKNKKIQNKQTFDSQNIFSQTFGSLNEGTDLQLSSNVEVNQVPFLNIDNPPKTAKFNNFNQNMTSLGKTDGGSNSTFQGTSFSDHFQMQGPLKSSRLPQNDKLVNEISDNFELKKSKSNDDDLTPTSINYNPVSYPQYNANEYGTSKKI